MAARIAPSLLSADFARLAEAIALVEHAGADCLHVDVMDGHFVPNITIGVPVVAAIRRVTTLPLDVHLMIEHPARYVDAFAAAGATTLTIHVEADRHLHRTLGAIRALGLKAGVALNPATPIAAIDGLRGVVDLVLVMSVNPGFGGQVFIPGSLDKVRAARRWADSAGTNVDVEVDGGVDLSNAGLLVEAGASLLVAGASIFGSPDPAAATRALARLAGRN
jgi:ribulose-phosphate 3-epimerase